MNLEGLRIGYVPYDPDLKNPGDRRRFCYYARARQIDFSIADPSGIYDIVVLSERADITRWCDYRPGKARIVYDLIDSYLDLPWTDIKASLRGLAKFVSRQNRKLRLNHWKAIEAMVQRADAVVCSTQEQKSRLADLCDNVHIILDVHSMVAQSVKTNYARGDEFKLVWEGLPHNVRTLQQLKPILRQLQQEIRLSLHVITDPQYYQFVSRFRRRHTWEDIRDLCDRVQLHDWNETTNSDVITSCDLAVIPIDLDSPMDAGKPENKLLLFWRMGMPTVVTGTKAYSRTMQAAGLSMACETATDWLRVLGEFSSDEKARKHAGKAGFDLAEREHSEDRVLERWDALFASL